MEIMGLQKSKGNEFKSIKFEEMSRVLRQLDCHYMTGHMAKYLNDILIFHFEYSYEEFSGHIFDGVYRFGRTSKYISVNVDEIEKVKYRYSDYLDIHFYLNDGTYFTMMFRGL